MSLPENHLELVKRIMIMTQKFRSNAREELNKFFPGKEKQLEHIFEHCFPYMFSKNNSSVLITACERYLDYPTGQCFYNIITIANNEPGLIYMLAFLWKTELPKPKVEWVLEGL